MPFQEWTETIGSSLSEAFVRMWIPAYHQKINHLVMVIANGACAHSSQSGLADPGADRLPVRFGENAGSSRRAELPAGAGLT
jgi:hypothetical protein